MISPGGHRLYSAADLEMHAKGVVQIAKEWVSAQAPVIPHAEWYCQTSDIFKARLERMVVEMESLKTLKDIASLVSSIAGEIGGNSFDHNIGNWPNIPGVFFAYNLGKRFVVLADRGRGVLQTLHVVRPLLENEQEALNVAFTEVVTGRAPEKRGNGLKYVRKVVDAYGFDLLFQSGDARVHINGKENGVHAEAGKEFIAGCLFIMKF